MTDVTVSPQDEPYLLDWKIALVPMEPLEGCPQAQDMFLNWIIEQFVTEEEEIKPLVNDFRRGLHDVDFNPHISISSDNAHRMTQSRLSVLRSTTGGRNQRSRQETASSIVGSNPYGRAGCQRCTLCRKHRQKCEYVQTDLPCLYCQKRGAPCDDKIWGPKTQSKLRQGTSEAERGQMQVLSLSSLSTSPGGREFITPFDSLYQQFFFEKRWDHAFTWLEVNKQRVGFVIVPMQRASLLTSSLPVKTASLALASFRKANNQENEHTFQYLGHCYRHLQDAIASSPGVEVVYTAYMLFKIAVCSKDTRETSLKHIFGMSRVMKYLRENSSSAAPGDDWEWEWMDGLLLDALGSAHWFLTNELTVRGNVDYFSLQIPKICEMMEDRHLERLRHSIRPSLTRVLESQVYLNFLFMYYLLLVEGGSGDYLGHDTMRLQLVTARFVELADELLEAIPQHDIQLTDDLDSLNEVTLAFPSATFSMLSPFRSGCLVLYLQTRFLKCLVEENHKSPYAESLALLLCQVSVQGEYTPWKLRIDLRLLTLAGLVFTKARHPELNSWISGTVEARLQIYLKFCPSKLLFLKQLPQLINNLNNCASIHDGWKDQAADFSSLRYCIIALGSILDVLPLS